MAVIYYKIRGSRIRVREYWRICPDPFSFVIAVCAKLFGGIAPAWSVPLCEIPKVDFDELPKSASRILDRHTERFEDEGYRHLYFTQAPLLERNRVITSSVLLSTDGWSLAQVMFIRNAEQTVVGMTVGCLCDDNTSAVTTNRKLELDFPPGHRVERYIRAGPSKLVSQFHQHARRWEEEDGMRPVPLDEQKVTDLLLRVSRDEVEFYAARGVIVPMTRRDLERLGLDPDQLD
jgi:hypothetical protein